MKKEKRKHNNIMSKFLRKNGDSLEEIRVSRKRKYIKNKSLVVNKQKYMKIPWLWGDFKTEPYEISEEEVLKLL